MSAFTLTQICTVSFDISWNYLVYIKSSYGVSVQTGLVLYAINNGYLSVSSTFAIYVSNILAILYCYQFCCKTNIIPVLFKRHKKRLSIDYLIYVKNIRNVFMSSLFDETCGFLLKNPFNLELRRKRCSIWCAMLICFKFSQLYTIVSTFPGSPPRGRLWYCSALPSLSHSELEYAYYNNMVTTVRNHNNYYSWRPQKYSVWHQKCYGETV